MISDIVSLYRGRGLRGAELRAALRRHARILAPLDFSDAFELRERAAKEGGTVVPVCGKLEAELAELDPADRKEMLASMDLAEPALSTLAREAYRLLGLQVYFTAGPKEIRAWEIPVGATAPQAAGVIHTDFERGFIRAEVYTLDDLKQYKTEAAIKAAGRMRSEGKGYVMKDGDVVHFLFNV